MYSIHLSVCPSVHLSIQLFIHPPRSPDVLNPFTQSSSYAHTGYPIYSINPSILPSSLSSTPTGHPMYSIRPSFLPFINPHRSPDLLNQSIQSFDNPHRSPDVLRPQLAPAWEERNPLGRRSKIPLFSNRYT